MMLIRIVLVGLLSLADDVNGIEFYRERVQKQRRQVVFNSRWLSGECLPICESTGNAPPTQTQSPTSVPTNSPTSTPTTVPTNKPTHSPTLSPTPGPTNKPTNNPTSAPTSKPTNSPTLSPTPGPTNKPTNSPTFSPTPAPTNKPTNNPTLSPTPGPTNKPTNSPTLSPTPAPTNKPTNSPTLSPTQAPTNKPTNSPTPSPTLSPTNKPTAKPTNVPTTQPTPSPTPGSGPSCPEMLNLGYGFSAAMHDPNLGNSHYGQDGQCFPHVQSMGSPPKKNGHDDAIAVLVGGNYDATVGAELEGNLVVLGNMHLGASGPSNFVSVGWGSQVVPHSGGQCIKVGGNLRADRRTDVFFGTGSCNVVYRGTGTNVNQYTANSVTKDANLDLTKYEVHIENLRKKSAFWASLPDTQGTSTNFASRRLNIKCSAANVIQIITIPMNLFSSLSSGGDFYVFSKECYDKTILLNVKGTGAITVPAQEMLWHDAQGNEKRGGWENFSSCMNSNILWNFASATKVTINGWNEWNGSVLVTGDLVLQTIGQSGRTMVLGNLLQNKGGSEFHSFDFNPPIPLPEMDCADYLSASSGNSYQCVWPADTLSYTMITKGDATSAAHSFYTKLAIGGTFFDSAPNQHATVDGIAYYGALGSPMTVNFNKGKQQINSLADVPINFAHFEWLAQNLKSGTYGNKRVFVVTQPKSGCYNTYDFIPGGQPTIGADVLVVFNTAANICLTRTSDGRQFGPTVLAPFSHVELQGDAGYIDGTVISKSFTTSGSNAGQLQQHGKMYSGTIECVTGASTSSISAPVPASAVTPNPTPNPTKSPTPNPTVPSGGGTGCCSWDYKTCGADAWCNQSNSNCQGSCSGLWLPNGALPNCVARWGECTNNVNGCCSPGQCQGDQWYKQCQ
ncbi:laminin G domain containing protein [Nitzschia inconspicua]|uniref:Laminin G domain containing protein n=1 Tax=Nitzschia inconspicua TaxID=303405 RepID=A0A9K3LLB0_9STRA|nr:laminin G domain containing protein [Nitzschia inconspicua]